MPLKQKHGRFLKMKSLKRNPKEQKMKEKKKGPLFFFALILPDYGAGLLEKRSCSGSGLACKGVKWS